MHKLLFIAPLLLLTACRTPSPEASPPPAATPTPSTAIASPSSSPTTVNSDRAYQVGQTFDFTGISVTVKRVLVGKDVVLVDYAVKNTSSGVVSIYPDQGAVVVGDRQFDANTQATEGDVSGELQPGVQVEGIVTYPVKGEPLQPDQVKSLKVVLGAITAIPEYERQDATITLSLK